MAKKASLKELIKASNNGPVRRLQNNEVAEVRFLYEMEDESDDGRALWTALGSSWDAGNKRTTYVELGDGPRNPDIREGYFTAAYDAETGEVHVWELRKKLARTLADFEEEYDTICDRNYKLKRKGEGLETEYIATPMSPAPMSKAMKKAKSKSQSLLDDAIDRIMDND